MEKRYLVVFHIHGFDPEDVTEKEMELIKKQCVELNNMFARIMNPLYDKVNTIWDQYDSIPDDNPMKRETEKIMGIEARTTYYDWVKKWMILATEDVDRHFARKKKLVRCNIFRDGENPILGAKIADHEDWTIDWTLKEVSI